MEEGDVKDWGKKQARAVIAEATTLLGEAAVAVEAKNYLYAEALVERAKECLEEQDVFGILAGAQIELLVRRNESG